MKPVFAVCLSALLLCAVAARAATPCTPAASLYGQTLCTEALDDTGSDLTRGMAASEGKLLGQNAQAQQGQKQALAMQSLIWRTALIRRFGAAAVTPSTDEITKYRQHLDASIDASNGDDTKMADYLRSLLDKYIYPPDREAQLNHLLATTNLSVKLYGDRQTYKKQQLPREYQLIVDASENRIAGDMVAAWKQDKALYDAYGGPVTATPAGGLQPVDAYRKFFATVQADGHYKAIDPAYATALADLGAHLASIKMSKPLPPAVVSRYFANPPWDAGDKGAGFLTWKQHLDMIPTLGLKKTDADAASLIGHKSLPPNPIQ